MIEMLPAEYYPQLYEELCLWKSQQPQQQETRTEQHSRLLDNYYRAKRELDIFHLKK